MDINELENMLDVLQNIGEREVGRRPNPPVVLNNNNYHQYRGTPNFHRGARGGNFDNRGESWRCIDCNVDNYANRTNCFICHKNRECARNERMHHQPNQQQRGAEYSRGAPRGGGNYNRGRGGNNQAVAGPSTVN